MTQQSEPAQLRDDLMVRLRAEAQLSNNQILPELLRHLGLASREAQTLSKYL